MICATVLVDVIVDGGGERSQIAFNTLEVIGFRLGAGAKNVSLSGHGHLEIKMGCH